MPNFAAVLNNILKRKFTNLNIHSLYSLKYGTLKKYHNVIKSVIYYTFGLKLQIHPSFCAIDVTNYCNLRCPLCANKNTKRKPNIMSLEDFKKIIDAVKPYTFTVSIYSLGEPTLNPELPQMIEYCHKNRMATIMHTNGNLLTPDLTKKLIESGLDFMSVSIDGINQTTYEKYRKGGNYYSVMNNIRHMADIKRHKKKRTPYIIWQYLLFKHTLQYKNVVPKIYRYFGFNYYDIEMGLGSDPDFVLQNDELDKEYPSKHFIFKKCFQPFLRLFISDDFKLTYCGPLCINGVTHQLDINSKELSEDIVEYYNSHELTDLRKYLCKIRKSPEVKGYAKLCEKYCNDVFNRNS